MSTTKGSKTAVAKGSANVGKGAAGLNRERLAAQIKKDRKLPGAVHSSKYAPRTKKAKYVNSKRDAKKARLAVADTPADQLKAARVKRTQKRMAEVYAKKAAKAAAEGKPAPKKGYPSKAQKVQLRRKASRTKRIAAREEKSKTVKAALDAFQQSLGKNLRAASRKFVALGRKVDPKLVPAIKKRHQRKSKSHTLVIKGLKPAQKANGRRPLSLVRAIEYIKAGKTLPKTHLQRVRERKQRSLAHAEAQRKAAAAKAKGPKKVNPKRAEKAAKAEKAHKKAEAKGDKFFAKLKAQKQLRLKRAEDKKNGVVAPKKKSVKKPTTGHRVSKLRPRRHFKKISIVNLDRVEKSFKKTYRKSQQKLRSSLVPGTVVIILKGKYAGRRAIFLRQLRTSRDLLVSGPFAINGVPLYRIAQPFVIATSTRVDLKGMPDLHGAQLNDRLFASQKIKRRKQETEADFYNPEFKALKKKVSPKVHKTPIQKSTDKFLSAAIAKTPLLKQYLQASFSIGDKDAPHRMKF